MRARTASAMLLLYTAVLSVCPAAGQGPETGDALAFDVPAGSAEDAIAIFSKQSHRLIVAPGEALAGIRTPALRGRYRFEDALSLLLKGLPVQLASDDGRTVVLVRKLASAAPKPAPAPREAVNPNFETIVVSSEGYRASLESSTLAKRNAVGFSESVFAEEIGKFPDTNIAEALNRIPGVTIWREINGEGINIQIRTLGTNFTKVLLNGNPIGVASTGATDSTNTNREVDLNWFPPELFTKLSVYKSLSADQLEGGAAGSVSMRSTRPFDRPGFHFSYNLDLTDQTTTNLAIGKRGTLIVSDTEGSFGALFAIAGVQSNMMVTGWEDGNSGWVTPNLPAGACGANNQCSQFGGNAWTISSTVPSGVYIPIPGGFPLASGYAPVTQGGKTYFPAGYPVDNSMLYALNPGLADAGCPALNPSAACLNQAMTRLSNTLLPRLGRPMFEKGSRDRHNVLLSLEYWPGDHFHAYADMVAGRINNDMNRTDIDWGVRGGNSATQMIPANVIISPDWLAAPFTAGLGGAAQTGTFYNAVFGLEARSYKEKGDFLNINPGVRWQPAELLQFNLEAYYTRSHFFRVNPTVMATTCTASAPPAGIDNCPNGPPALGTVLQFDARGAYPSESINLDLNDPRNYEWNLGRLNLIGEKRYSRTFGSHLDVTFGGDKFAVKAGAAYDEVYRLITTLDDSVTWQAAACGSNPSTVLLGPNTALPGCSGQSGSAPAGWTRPAYPGFGTGYSAGAPPLQFGGSLVPTSALADYIIPGPTGFATVDYEKFFAATGYYDILNKAVDSIRCIPHCSPQGYPDGAVLYPGFGNGFSERNLGFYAKASGQFGIAGRLFRFDAGLRWVTTWQNVISGLLRSDARNDSLQDGGYYPNYYILQPRKRSYQAYLPSASLVYEINDDFLLRLSLSRSMNRPNPSAMLGTVSFGDPNVTTAVLGNPYLKPYYANNIDIGGEYFTGGEGYVGVSLFRKSISGFTALLTTTRNFAYLAQYGINWNTLAQQQQLNYQTSGGPSGVPCNSDATCADHPIAVNQQVNLKGLEIINGVELDIVQPLDRLLAPFGLTGFGFSGNVTIIDQRSTGAVPTFALGVAPLQYNLTAYYEGDGLQLRLTYNWNDTSYGSASNNQNVCFPAVPSGDKTIGCPAGLYTFTAAYGQADFSSSLKLSKLFGTVPTDPALSFEIQNVFDARQSSYAQMKSALHSYFIKGRTLMLGVRGSL